MISIDDIIKHAKMASCYTRDIEKNWKHQESQRRIFGFRSPQLPIRNHLIEWIKNVSAKISVSCRTIHLAIYILDMFMDRHSITKDRLGFVALVCLMLAAKFEEVDSKVPKISELNEYDGSRYSNKEFIQLEVSLLKFMDFGLMQPTAAHFVEYYAAVTVIPNDLRYQRRSFCSLFEIAKTVVSELLDVSLKEVQFLQLPPSQVAATCVLCTRRRMNLSPAWTVVHVGVTGYPEDSLSYSARLLMRKLQEIRRNKLSREAFQSPDHGYVSDS